MDGYTFAGWSDDDGNIIRQIKIGETDHKTYTANWLSDRNQAWAKRELGEPIVYEDNNVILFAYEIGEVRNVPISVIHDFGRILSDGVSKEVTTEYSTTTSVTQMEAYTSALAKSTTESFSWTLSEGWSDSVSVDSEWLKENEMTEEEAKSICTNESENWYISSGKSGTDTTVNLDYTNTYALTTTTNNTKKYDTKDKERRQDFSAELGIDVGTNKTIEIATPSVDLSFDAKYEQGRATKTKTGTETDNGGSDQTGTVVRASTENTHVSGWNNEESTGGSKSTSEEASVVQALSEKISKKTGYGRSYIQSGDQSNTQDCTSSSSSNEEYASSVTFSKIIEEKKTETFKTENTKSGFHRWVIAGTAHVFGVVGYDIAKQSYFTYSFSIMDDQTFEFEDYSYNSSDYDDNQRSTIPFEAPTDIVDYVIDRVCGSEGLEVSKTGTITEYTGDDLYSTEL